MNIFVNTEQEIALFLLSKFKKETKLLTTFSILDNGWI